MSSQGILTTSHCDLLLLLQDRSLEYHAVHHERFLPYQQAHHHDQDRPLSVMERVLRIWEWVLKRWAGSRRRMCPLS
jgi:hypothetical protein